VTYLQAHYRDPELNVAQLASLCHVSEVYFRRVYRECFGTSPWQRILELRFSYACTLLQSGYYTVKEIANLAGFSDVKYFRTAFGKRFGCTPTEYASQM
jgi:AraC-like DNA-binding protein